MFVRWLAGVSVFVLMIVNLIYFHFFHIHTPTEPELSGTLEHASLDVNGDERSFSYYLPKDLSEKPAIIFVLHGSKGSGETIRQRTAFEFDRIADMEGLIIVYPDGYENHWNDCRGSATYSANTLDINDTQFFDRMFAYFSESYLADMNRMFVTGFSNGGQLAYRLAFEMPEKIKAIAPIAANIPAIDSMDCQQQGKAVSVAIFNGTEDPVNPYNGGLVELLGDTSRGTVLSAEASANYWLQLSLKPESGESASYLAVEHDAISLSESDNNPDTQITLKRWEGRNNIEVRLYTLKGSGHVIPSKQVNYGKFFGGDAGDIEAASEIWHFFSGLK